MKASSSTHRYVQAPTSTTTRGTSTGHHARRPRAPSGTGGPSPAVTAAAPGAGPVVATVFPRYAMAEMVVEQECEPASGATIHSSDPDSAGGTEVPSGHADTVSISRGPALRRGHAGCRGQVVLR
jgi:hypothetical protein